MNTTDECVYAIKETMADLQILSDYIQFLGCNYNINSELECELMKLFFESNGLEFKLMSLIDVDASQFVEVNVDGSNDAADDESTVFYEIVEKHDHTNSVEILKEIIEVFENLISMNASELIQQIVQMHKTCDIGYVIEFIGSTIQRELSNNKKDMQEMFDKYIDMMYDIKDIFYKYNGLNDSESGDLDDDDLSDDPDDDADPNENNLGELNKTA